ncbi:MAG TPA: hypothetical protein ENJ82_05030, partial [Bacteroidetes bacterium]|nr:hypothetical protein [Bacteroidota bacterium]
MKIYPFHLFTFQYRLGFEKIISSRYSAIFEITRITKGPYGSSDQPILGTCKKFLPTSGVKLQGGLRYYLSEEKSNFHWFAEATFLYQSLAYKAFSFVPANQCAKFYPYYKRIAPQQKDLGFAVYLGQQIAVHGNIRVESYLGLSVRNRHENQGQTSPGEDPPHYHSPGWFQDFQKIKPPFSEQ